MSDNNNTSSGYGSLQNNEGSNNSAFGAYSAYTNTSGFCNTSVGSNCLFYNTEGDNNTGVGAGTLCNNTTGSLNTAVGSNALEGIVANRTVGNRNTAIGVQALYSNRGNFNTGVGIYAALDITTGNFNTFLGANTGFDSASNQWTRSTAVGYGAKISSSDQIMMGVDDTNVMIPGSAEITTLLCGPIIATDISCNSVRAATFTSTSDYRFKKNIKPLLSSRSIDDLKPVEYDLLSNDLHDMGFIAHEVQEIFPFLVHGDKDCEKMQSMNYTGLIPLLVKEVQDLKKENKLVKERLEELENKFKNLINQ